MDVSQNHVVRKKSDTKHDTLYLKFWKKQNKNLVTEFRIIVAWVVGREAIEDREGS